MPEPRLVALGDLLLDVVVTPIRPIELGTDVPGTLTFKRGGSAATTATAFARAGGSASLITSIGGDRWGRQLATSLRGDGVRVHAVVRPGRTGRLAAVIDDRGERSFVTERGAADGLRPRDIKAAWLRGADVLHVPAYSLFSEPIGSASVAAARAAQDAGAATSSDLSSQGPLLAYGVRRSRARIAELAPDVLFANRDEAAVVLGRRGRRAWPGLLGMAPVVVVKDGAAGCRVLWRASDADAVLQVDVAAKRVGPVDTTGAGDAFAAGFLYSIFARGNRSALGDARSLRAAALAGHRVAAAALRRGRPEMDIS
jgi:sugar/nucleoside kinase (ribokinase family)